MAPMGKMARVWVVGRKVGIDLLPAVHAFESIPFKHFPAPLADVLEAGEVHATVLSTFVKPLADVGVTRMKAGRLRRFLVEFMRSAMQRTPPRSYSGRN